jgi:CO/xanthine dehydrogenase FAD-binding subunit
MREPEVLQPRSTSALVEALGRATPQSRLIAGGSDLMLHLRQSAQLPDTLIDLSGVAELQGICINGTRMHIGSMTRFGEIAESTAVRQGAACLAQAAASVGSMQIRNMATIGGNVANASPCADAVPALLVLQADVGILNSSGHTERRALTEVLQAASEDRMPRNEVIVDFSFELLGANLRSAFAKVGARTSVTIAKINAALVVECAGPKQVISRARAAFGSLGAFGFVDPACGGLLLGRHIDLDTANLFAQACTDMVDRRIPQRASRPYKRLAIKGIAHDLIANLTPFTKQETL